MFGKSKQEDNDKVDDQYEYLTDQERRDEWRVDLARNVVRDRAEVEKDKK